MRISDWSSDVFSSDLLSRQAVARSLRAVADGAAAGRAWLSAVGVVRQSRPHRRIFASTLRPAARVQLERRGIGICNDGISADGAAGAIGVPDDRPAPGERCGDAGRSEEHTSELQSLMRISYA